MAAGRECLVGFVSSGDTTSNTSEAGAMTPQAGASANDRTTMSSTNAAGGSGSSRAHVAAAEYVGEHE